MNAISRTVVHIKPGKRSEFVAFIEKKANEISSISGLMNWGLIYTGQDELTVVAAYEDMASAEKATAFVNQAMSEVVPLVVEPPVRKIFDAQWH